jgi:hypothetical protein
VTFSIEIVLRESDSAVTDRLSHPAAPDRWTVEDVREILKKMLTAIDRARNPDAPAREVTLRGFSWIVEPFDTAQGRPRDEGQVVIAIEIPTGAAVAGPFAIEEARLTSMITSAMGRPSASTSVH